MGSFPKKDPGYEVGLIFGNLVPRLDIWPKDREYYCNDKQLWRIITSGGSRILVSELNVNYLLTSYKPDVIKDFASQILKNKIERCSLIFSVPLLYIFVNIPEVNRHLMSL